MTSPPSAMSVSPWTEASSASALTAQDELALLDRVLMRLASADSDQALSLAVQKFLPPSLLKLSSSAEGVRKKVMELLVHINKRVKNNANIQLPMDTLLVQYQDPSATSFVTNFTVIYIKMGFPRAPPVQQVQWVGPLLAALADKPESHRDSLLLMLIPVLGEIKVSDDPAQQKTALGLHEKPQVRKLLVDFLADYLLLPYGSHPSLKPAEEPGQEPIPLAVPAGLSEASWKRVASEALVPSEILEKNKVQVLKFLGLGIFDEADIALHFVIGLADTRHSVTAQADTNMRKLGSFLDWNDPGVVSRLYALFLGTLMIKDKPPIKPEHRRMPANTRIRLKLMPFLLKSREAAIQFPACIQVTFDLLFGTTGNSNPKLKMSAVSFIHHIIYHCPSQRLSAMGAVLLSALTRLVNEPESEAKLRASCYVAIGKLGLKVPQLVNKDATMIQTFFEAISKEDKETQMSVQEAMALMAPSFRQMEKSNLKFVEALLATYIEKEEPQVRLVSVQYAGEVFRFVHVPSRYILLLGAGDIKENVVKEARNHLYQPLHKFHQMEEARFKRPGDVQLNSSEILPEFRPMLQYVIDKAAIRIKTKQKFVIGDKVLAFNPVVYTEMVKFLRLCLLNSAGTIPPRDFLSQPRLYAPKISKFVANDHEKGHNHILKFVDFSEKLLSAVKNLESVQSLLQIVGCTFPMTAQRFAGRVGWIKGLLDNTRDDVRENVAELYAIIVAELEDELFEKAMGDLTRGFKEKSLEYQHGVIMALGFSFGRRFLRLKARSAPTTIDERNWVIYASSVQLILAQLGTNSHTLMTISACTALIELGRCGPLPLEDEGNEGKDIKSKLAVVKRLLTILKTGKNSMRVRERAALALGFLCVGDPRFPYQRLILEEFLELASEVKDIELHFTMGEAIVYAAFGSHSPSARDYWLISEEDFTPPLDQDKSPDELVTWLLSQLCGKYIQSTHPNVKQSACLWLLALLKHGETLQVVRDRLLDIQSAFMTVLGDNNEMIQDAASKGLGLVYDCSSEGQKEEMVKGLLQTLTEGKREVQKVGEDTKIFEEGQLGKTPTGGNLSTYKELCSLASDLNQPDLVYKFMNLANHNAMWNSKKGAAFGFSNIAAKAGEQLEQHLPKIIPKLYRYQFDPNPKIQESMTSIWHALVPETNKTVDKYLSQIVREISDNLENKLWRVRESCCNAIQDLLRGRGLDGAMEHLPNLWLRTFRVMDDIKESVRLSATKAAGSLSRISIKMCDIDQGAKGGEEAVKVVIPPLLEKGLTSSVSEVRSISIATIMKITKSAGVLLKPHLSILIPALLHATSELEGKELNYLSVRLANDVSVQEKLDMARIASAKSSPMMDCVNQVLQYVDTDILEQLVPKVVDLIKSNTGIGAKGCTAHFVVVLCHHCPLDLQPYSGKILAAFVSGLSDRTPAVRKTYASAIGHLMKTAKDSSMEKLFAKLRTWYMEKTDEATRWAVAYTYEAINQQNADKMKTHAAQALPIVFLAMHEEKRADNENEELLQIFEEVWLDCTPGTEAGIRIYLKEIMSILSLAIESQQWKVKAQTARAISTIAKKLGSSLPTEQTQEFLILLLNALSGRTWDGKETLLVALADVCEKNSEAAKTVFDDPSNEITVDNLMSCVLRECKKDKVFYKIVALESAGRIIDAFQTKHFKELYDIVFPIIKKEDEVQKNENGGESVAGQKNEDQDKEKEEIHETEEMLELRHAIYVSIGSAWPSDPEFQSRHLVELLISCRNRIQSTIRKNMLAIVKCLNSVIDRWHQGDTPDIQDQVFVELGKILSGALVIPKSKQLRWEALDLLDKGIALLTERNCPEINGSFREEIAKSLDDVIKDVSSDAATKTKARELRKLLTAIAPEPPTKMDET
ncbi:hypothetical protein TCAL_11939 [Tigriopus californicus]|uniref:TOG domain-containing protein n=1 Tax=Tigriopus californicus TaxID=6832 RepID=A0A553P3J8_TIGCA|nr:proteasome adapter and scaffold protein ECM29-like [Tigriopus californicus]TRY72263.1 hypothetical protein TCAL_11939 [Tigriopus californicus]